MFAARLENGEADAIQTDAALVFDEPVKVAVGILHVVRIFSVSLCRKIQRNYIIVENSVGCTPPKGQSGKEANLSSAAGARADVPDAAQVRQNGQRAVGVLFAGQKPVHRLYARIAADARRLAHAPAVAPQTVAFIVQTGQETLHAGSSSVTSQQGHGLTFLQFSFIDNKERRSRKVKPMKLTLLS